MAAIRAARRVALDRYVHGLRPPLTIAAAQPPCVSRDVPANARAHADAVRAAQARVVVFPELSLTGYELEAEAVSPGDAALHPIVEACAATGSIALAGAPILDGHDRARIAMLRIDSAGVELAYAKSHLGGDEPARFSPGEGPSALEVDGWRLGLGICKDTGVAEHVGGTAALGIDAYVAGLVHLPEERSIQDARGASIARECAVHVVFASFAGPTGGGFDRTAGSSTIWSESGAVLARAGAEPGELVRSSIS